MNKWFNIYDIVFEETNYVDDGAFNIDVDFLYKGKNLELKTSLTPDKDAIIKNVITRRDIKLIKRGNDSIRDLKGDVHLQIYYTQKRKKKDNWLKAQIINLQSTDIDYLYKSLLADCYKDSTFFVAWIDKETLVNRINSLPVYKRTWSFPGSQRLFWNCKLNSSKKPLELIEYLKKF